MSRAYRAYTSFLAGSAAARLPAVPAAAAGWAKSVNPLLRHEAEGVHRLGSLGYQTGPSEPQVTSSWTATERFRLGVVFRTLRPHRVNHAYITPYLKVYTALYE